MQLTDEQRIFVVEVYFATRSIVEIQNRFRQRFQNRQPPTKRSIKKLVKKFQERGTVENQNAGRSGRLRTTRTGANIDRVRVAIEANPLVSARRNGLRIPKSSFNEITKQDLNFYPYKMFIRHKLEDFDYHRRTIFCQWLLNKFTENGFREKIIIGDEAAFQMNANVSNRYVHSYAEKGHPPDYSYDRSNSREKLTVWAALCGNGDLLGPYFLNGNVNGQRYLDMINQNVLPDMNLIYNFDIFNDIRFGNEVWWFQDGAPSHQWRLVSDRLRELFGDQVVALNRDPEWPPRSPDLTPCDFFLWGYLKQRVYVTPPPNIETLRQRIIDECNILRNDRQKILNSINAMRTRAQKCIDRNGGHVEGHYL